ncbi:MAG: hypothetical protein H0T42_13670, partial [Deltaproteobacteria bacterium]|nr:hypothetical protein [Deltaproteobacteria bacterium]
MSGFTPSTNVLASAAGPSSASQALLIAIVSLLALVIAGLVAMAITLRRRGRAQPAPTPSVALPQPMTAAPPAA